MRAGEHSRRLRTRAPHGRRADPCGGVAVRRAGAGACRRAACSAARARVEPARLAGRLPRMSDHNTDLRDTKYAREIARSVIQWPGDSEARIERLEIKSSGTIEIRLSWWKGGQMMPKPLDLSEHDFMRLIAQGF